MIDPSFADITDQELAEGNPFMHPYPPTVKELEEKVADLQNRLDNMISDKGFVSNQLQRRVAQIESFESALKHNGWDFDNDTLSDLAGYFDITLDREFDVTITVTFSGTVTAPMDYDMDDLENDLQATIDTHHYGNSDVIVDLSEDNMEIDYREY